VRGEVVVDSSFPLSRSKQAELQQKAGSARGDQGEITRSHGSASPPSRCRPGHNRASGIPPVSGYDEHRKRFT